MDDLEQYIEKRKKEDLHFAQGFEKGFEVFKQKWYGMQIARLTDHF